MTLYLTDNTPPAEIARAKASGFVHAVKYYPAGATTNSDSGVTALERAYPALAAMEQHGVVLSLHGEVTDPDVDMFDRERVFVDALLAAHRARLSRRCGSCSSTSRRARPPQFVAAAPADVAATITPQHLLWSRNALFAGGIRPHLYCLPILKRETHRAGAGRARRRRATRSSSSAPTARRTRGTPRRTPAAAPAATRRRAALELYAEAFEDAGALDRLEGFASFFGADFYGLPRNADTVTLVREPWTVPAEYPFGERHDRAAARRREPCAGASPRPPSA